jgi:hypothetical protein
MQWHVLAPHSDGGHNSIDYRDTLDEALMALRYWRRSSADDLAVAKGVNGAPLRWVVYYVSRDIHGRRDVPTGAYATARGAKRAMTNLERNLPEGVNEYGRMRVILWRRSR